MNAVVVGAPIISGGGAGGGTSDDHLVKAANTDTVFGTLSDKINMGTNISSTLIGAVGNQQLQLNVPDPTLTGIAFLQSMTPQDCNQVGGFTGRFNATKISAIGSGQVTKTRVYVYNAYGSRQVQMGIYDAAGSLIGATLLTTIPAGQNKMVTLPLVASINITSGSDYWLGVYGNGIDIPTFTSFSVFGGSFPSGTIAVENTSAPGLPATINSSFPYSAVTTVFPISAYS